MERARKPRKRDNSISICCCSSPQSSFLYPHTNLTWFEEDVWTEIAKFLDGRSLVNLASANRWFHQLIMEESIWKFACLRDLQVPPPNNVAFSWIKLYASAFDGSHSYSFRQSEKHIDWMRIGAFFFDSPHALVTEMLSLPVKVPEEESLQEMVQKTGACVLRNIKTGIWIADLQLVQCPVCNLNTCEGTMQTLDVRHLELFLQEGYKNGAWDYKDVASHRIEKHCNGASGGIFDIKHLKSSCTSEILDPKSWTGKPSDWQPKARRALHAVAINTNLQQNDGLQVRYQAMREGPDLDGEDGEIVSIRVSQQLI
ncbi:putative F-box protein At3g61730 [Tasmannia lanceolata]|uniref:putative F-box protein At3g61730 n=1 Tax=Tasmannia lanceolata TaxID=3420 RepID=UPI00406434E9